MTRPTPQDPIIADLVAMARRAQLSRRRVLQGAGIGAGALALAACTPGGAGAPQPAKDISDTDKTLTWGNWPAYIDEDDDGNYPTLLAFDEQTGIKVEYKVEIDDNNTYYGTIKDQLALGQATGSDTFCLTEWMVARLIRFGYVQDLDAANIPNKKNLAPALLNPDFDPGRAKSLPWQNGFAGIAWDTDALPGGLESVEDLWQPALKGKVTVLSEMRDTMGLLLLAQGVDISSSDWGTDEYAAAIEVLEKNVTSGQILGIKGNEYLEDFNSGNAVAGIVWSGDITAANLEAGYEKFLFIGTKPRGYVRPEVARPALIRRIFRRYPAIADALIARPAIYNAAKDRLVELERQGKAQLFFPEDMQVASTERNVHKLSANYQAGKAQTYTEWPRWKEFLLD